MSYRKRDIAHWNQGKSCKGTRKAKERVYVASEINFQIAEQDDNFRYRHYSHTPNREAQINHRIQWYEKVLAESKYSGWFHDHARDALRKAKKQLTELQEKENAVRPQQDY